MQVCISPGQWSPAAAAGDCSETSAVCTAPPLDSHQCSCRTNTQPVTLICANGGMSWRDSPVLTDTTLRARPQTRGRPRRLQTRCPPPDTRTAWKHAAVSRSETHREPTVSRIHHLLPFSRSASSSRASISRNESSAGSYTSAKEPRPAGAYRGVGYMRAARSDGKTNAGY